MGVTKPRLFNWHWCTSLSNFLDLPLPCASSSAILRATTVWGLPKNCLCVTAQLCMTWTNIDVKFMEVSSNGGNPVKVGCQQKKSVINARMAIATWSLHVGTRWSSKSKTEATHFPEEGPKSADHLPLLDCSQAHCQFLFSFSFSICMLHPKYHQ